MNSAIYNKNGEKIAGSNAFSKKIDSNIIKGIFPVYTDGILYTHQDDGSIFAMEVTYDVAKLIMKPDENVMTKNNFYKALFKGSLSNDDILTNCKRLKYKFEAERIVSIVSISDKINESLFMILEELFNENCSDVIEIDEQNCIVVYYFDEDEDIKEIYDIFSAVKINFINEFDTNVNIGIGNKSYNVTTIHESYIKADKALNIGKKISHSGGVWVYNSMMPELLLSNIKREELIDYNDFMIKIQSVVDDDMELMLDELFRENLNVSQTAKKMYMHRNTLIYRLDKIENATGLRVGVFEDAVILRMFLAIIKFNK